MSGIEAMRPLYLAADPTPVFAVLHPATGHVRERAVLLCPPFGWEEICSARSRRAWSERLAADGHSTLRFDLPGTGDSAGTPEDPDLVAAWIGATTSAAAWLRAASGCPTIVAVGIGLGGLIAARALDAGAPIDELVLWGVPARGRTLTRELRAFSRLQASELPQGDDPLPDGALVVAGHLLSAGTVAALDALDLETSVRSPSRALLLGREGMQVDPSLRPALERLGTDVRVADGPGFGAMMSEPHDARPPLVVFDTVASWLLGDFRAADRRSVPAGDPPPELRTLELTVAGAGVRETPVLVEQPFGSLFGVLAEPAGPQATVCVVLLNAGAITHIGPNRMWVEIARRWAARGVPVLRLDIGGIGESDGPSDAWSDDASFYVPEFVDEARAALDVLQTRGLGPRFVLGGLCSGAHWSLHGALRDERVTGALMINPRALMWDRWAITVALMGRLRALHSAHDGRGAARAAPSRSSVALRAAIRRLLLFLVRPWERARARHLDRAFDQLRDTGKSALVCFTGDEPLYQQFERDGRLTRLGRWPDLEIDLIAATPDTHTLRPLRMQREVHASLDSAIARELQRGAGAPVVPSAARRAATP
ncbi:MAG TPA: hypothetical protein VII98_15305 [Solirubrobacteraceae bacterium]